MSWGDVARGIGKVVQGLSDFSVVDNWLHMEDNAAFSSIEAQVTGSPAETVDRLDEALLARATLSLDKDERLRLIKFYAFFKTVETVHYQQFRGFPQ